TIMTRPLLALVASSETADTGTVTASLTSLEVTVTSAEPAPLRRPSLFGSLTQTSKVRLPVSPARLTNDILPSSSRPGWSVGLITAGSPVLRVDATTSANGALIITSLRSMTVKSLAPGDAYSPWNANWSVTVPDIGALISA